MKHTNSEKADAWFKNRSAKFPRSPKGGLPNTTILLVGFGEVEYAIRFGVQSKKFCLITSVSL